MREQRERLGQQSVARENRHAVAVNDVRRRPPAAQRVIVHRRKIVVDERVGVDQLDGAGAGQREPTAPVGLAGRALSRRFGGGQRQAGTEAFAAAEQRIAHGVERRAPERRRGSARGSASSMI